MKMMKAFSWSSMRRFCALTVIGAFLASLLLAQSACAQTSSPCPAISSLSGSGSTFVAPLFSKWFSLYAKAKCGVNVSYQAVGSGAGIAHVLDQTTDFGATDTPMTDTQLAMSLGGPILHIPVTIGAVTLCYHLPDTSTALALTGPIIADIFAGLITSWSDARLQALNPGLTLPNKPIIVVHRADGSGTTGIFTHYLSTVSASWQQEVGEGLVISWPVGEQANGNAGVASLVKKTPYSIGYVELAYADALHLSTAVVQNAGGDFVPASLETIQGAVENMGNIPPDLRFFMTNTVGDNAYPITGLTWVLVYQQQRDTEKGKALARLLGWMLHDGQAISETLNYASLPDKIVELASAKIDAMTCGNIACSQV